MIAQFKTEAENIVANIHLNKVISKPTIDGVSTASGGIEFSYKANAKSYLADGSVASFIFSVAGVSKTVDALNDSATFNYTPQGEIGDTIDLTVVAVDNLGNVSEKTVFTITITENNLPVMTNFSYSLPQHIYGGRTYEISFDGATDLDGDTITYKIEASSNFAVSKTTNIAADEAVNITTPAVTDDTYYEIAVIAVDSRGGESRKVISLLVEFRAPAGQVLFDTVGTHTFIVPDGVDSVCAVAVGGGQGGAYTWSNYGGAGGGLAWVNDIPVTAGEEITVVVGAGGSVGSNNGNAGGDSYFKSPSICRGQGGQSNRVGGSYTASSSYGTHGGGNGGSANAYGAGGAGGYTGKGGDSGQNGSGGGGGGGTYYSSTYGQGAGGGVGLQGQGNSGLAGYHGPNGLTGNNTAGYGGQGGSGGEDGDFGENANSSNGGVVNHAINGGKFGGGGGGSGTSWGGGSGGQGGVRVIWGENRSFPNNAKDV